MMEQYSKVLPLFLLYKLLIIRLSSEMFELYISLACTFCCAIEIGTDRVSADVKKILKILKGQFTQKWKSCHHLLSLK